MTPRIIYAYRWLHVDPCEEAVDKPLIYEKGWGKKLTYVIATSLDEMQDVTWRYSADHEALRQRRNEVREQWLTQKLLEITKECQKNYTEEQKQKLTERRYGITLFNQYNSKSCFY